MLPWKSFGKPVDQLLLNLLLNWKWKSTLKTHTQASLPPPQVWTAIGWKSNHC